MEHLLHSPRAVASIIGALGALTVGVSAYFPWLDDHPAHEVPINALVDIHVLLPAQSFWQAVAAPLLAVGAVGVLAALLRSRFGMAVGWLAGTVTVILWFFMRVIGDSGSASGAGPMIALVGLLVLIFGIAAMRSRHDEVAGSLSVFEGDPPQ